MNEPRTYNVSWSLYTMLCKQAGRQAAAERRVFMEHKREILGCALRSVCYCATVFVECFVCGE